MSSDRPSPPGDARHSPAQRRLLHALAGLAVAALAGGAFALTYDLLRDLAVEGRADRRWAPVYPAMADALTVLTLLALVVARQARWWTRWLRWTLLLALVAGTAALSVQHTVRGPDSLPDAPLRAGVAVAPHVMLVIAIWLWLTMVKQLRAPRPAPAPPPEAPSGLRRRREREHVKTLKPLPVASLQPGRAPEALEAPETGGRASDHRSDLFMPLMLDEEGDDGTEGKKDAGLGILDGDPPSRTFRSSPVPPAE
ncbi:DUF2637 domain-containing protein [Spirillospora sp. NBC_01491]|uniref:DUF2637 domain-containing protein n=1 Tax=Spirillospora sp. NBC_01491 TaxID=2976007 RepID=UPI002E309FC3|nr:DUF2637 domain-containing protein [Spirillospora sp. NBC_01491]